MRNPFPLASVDGGSVESAFGRCVSFALVTLALVGLTGIAGCTDDACIRVSALSNTCPSRDEALAIMNAPCGPRRVTSIATEGERENPETCCYDVYIDDDVPELSSPITSCP